MKPEALQKLRKHEESTQGKKDAVEKAVSKILKSDKPIIKV